MTKQQAYSPAQLSNSLSPLRLPALSSWHTKKQDYETDNTQPRTQKGVPTCRGVKKDAGNGRGVLYNHETIMDIASPSTGIQGIKRKRLTPSSNAVPPALLCESHTAHKKQKTKNNSYFCNNKPNNTPMNKILSLYIIWVSLAICGGTAQAQSSVIHAYLNEPNHKVLVCTNPADGNDILYHMDTSSSSRYFSYLDHTACPSRKFRLTSLASGSYSPNVERVDTTFYIEDMDICGDFCYLCGYLHLQIVSVGVDPFIDPAPDSNPRISHDTDTGFIAVFKINEISNENSTQAQLSYTIIPGSKTITRLKTHTNQNCIGAVALMASGTRDLLVLDENNINRYQDIYPLSGIETFSDFVFTDNNMVIVSSFGDNHTIGLRKASIVDILSTSLSPSTLATGYAVNTSLINTTPNPHIVPPTRMYTKDLRTDRIPLSDDFVVAYESLVECEDLGCECDSNHTCIFKFNGLNPVPVMDIAMLVSLDPEYMGGLEDARYTPLEEKVILKFKKNHPASDVEGMVQYPSLTNMGQVMCQSLGQYRFTSMDVLGTVSTSFAGWNVPKDCVSHLWHDLTQFPNSCLLTLPTSHSEEMTTEQSVAKDYKMKNFFKELVWKKAILVEVTLNCENKCTTY